jgi:Response regulator containing CheY-like receiver, AAA-type ATPase, and DNA-binding domains
MTATALFVDDEPNVLMALSRALHDEPLQIVTATGAEEALRILASRTVDVVVSDERMPGMSGTDFLAIVRERYPAIILIMLTGHATIESSVRSVAEGKTYRFLLKPCSPSLIALTIRSALLQRGIARHGSLPPEEKSGNVS